LVGLGVGDDNVAPKFSNVTSAASSLALFWDYVAGGIVTTIGHRRNQGNVRFAIPTVKDAELVHHDTCKHKVLIFLLQLDYPAF
jgi:hypothetical protein